MSSSQRCPVCEQVAYLKAQCTKCGIRMCYACSARDTSRCSTCGAIQSVKLIADLERR